MKTTLLKPTLISALFLFALLTISSAQTKVAETFASPDLLAATSSKNTPKKDLRAGNRNEFKNVEVYPMPETGLDLNSTLQEMIEYPESAIESGVEGVVEVLCAVEKDGSISSVMILEDIGSECADRVCKAVRQLKLKPAMENGYARKIMMIIPVRFELI
jgi:TonB family protein